MVMASRVGVGILVVARGARVSRSHASPPRTPTRGPTPHLTTPVPTERCQVSSRIVKPTPESTTPAPTRSRPIPRGFLQNTYPCRPSRNPGVIGLEGCRRGRLSRVIANHKGCIGCIELIRTIASHVERSILELNLRINDEDTIVELVGNTDRSVCQ
jgi:hypothetical protein